MPAIGVELLALAIYPFQPIGVVLRFVVVFGREIVEPAEIGLDFPVEFSVVALARGSPSQASTSA